MSHHKLGPASSLHSFQQRRYSEVSGGRSLVSLDTSNESSNKGSGDAEEEEHDRELEGFQQRKLGWKLLLHLPFDPIWENFIITIVIFDLALMTVDDNVKYIGGEKSEGFIVNDMAVDVLVFIDNFLILCAKAVSNLNISYEHINRPLWLILTNITSSIPDHFLTPLTSRANSDLQYILHIRDLLKILHVMYYTNSRLHMVRHQRVALAIYNYITTTFCLYIIVNYVFFLERCAIGLQFCNGTDVRYNIANAAATIVYRRLCEVTKDEVLLFTQAFFSYITYFCIFVPMVVQVMTALFNKNRHMYAFLRKKEIVETSLINSSTTDCVRIKINEFFNLHFKKNNGYNDAELKPFLETMAPSVVQELIVDINFKALKHSKLFQNMDQPFLRYVTMQMEEIFALPGQVLYEKGNNKHKMIYVASGVVQILSERDGDTAVLSLSAGTCLGETTLFVNYDSTCSIVCKEYSELQTLDMDKFAKIGRKFPKQMQRLRRMVLHRYGIAKKLMTLGKNLLRNEDDVAEKGTKIMWLNNILHRLMIKNDDNKYSTHVNPNIYIREDFDLSMYETVTSTATFLDLLAVAERTELVSDSVFYNMNSIPPILQPSSVLVNAWNILVSILAVIVCFTTPIYAFIDPLVPVWYWWVVNLSTIVYILDVYLMSTTAIKKQNLVIETVQEILSYRFSTLTFWFDLMAAYPLQLHAGAFLHAVNDMDFASLYLNRCCKYAYLIKTFKIYTKNWNWCSKIVLKFIEYNLIITYFVYFCAVFLHMLLCAIPGRKMCYGIFPLLDVMLEYLSFAGNFLYMIGAILRKDTVMAISGFYVTTAILTGTILLLLIAVIVSMQVMASYVKIELATVTSNLMWLANCFGVGNTCRRRIIDYIDTQWNHNSGQILFSSADAFAEMPMATYKRLKESSFQQYVKNMSVFQELGDDVIVELCALARLDMLPPKEVISYKGEAATAVHYLIDGYVELVSGANTAHVARPGDSLSVFEAYMNLPLLHTSITVTHCMLLTLPWKLTKLVIAPYDSEAEAHLDFKEEFARIKDRIIQSGSAYDLDDVHQIESFKNFGYNLKMDSEEEYEYYVPFDRLRKFAFVQYLLLRVTILPHGKFASLWELTRSIFAIASAVCFTIPFPVLVHQNYWSCWWWLLLFLDLTALLDIYLKLHYCYYNSKGLLVTHPLKTATHYIKHSFLLDLVAVFPIRFVFHATNANQSRVNSLFHLTRCLQLYRAHYYFKGISLVSKPIFKLVKYFFVLLIAVFIVSSLIVNIFCDFHINISASELFTDGVTCRKDSWFYGDNNDFVKPLNPLDVYVISVIIAAFNFFNLDFMVYIPGRNVMHVLIKHILLITGYCLYVILVARFSVILTKRTDLLEYQRAIYLLKNFMKRQKVGVITQQEIIQHYELQWKKNRNNGLLRITAKLHDTLQMDIVYDIYGKVLETSSVFHDVERQFYRKLLMVCKHKALPTAFTICKVNDIMSKIYIVYEGCVKVVAPDGTILTTLGIGSMFGNLEEYPRVRQTVGFMTSGNVELLVVATTDYFAILKSHPKLYRTFKYLTAIHIDYLKGRVKSDLLHDDVKKKSQKRLFKCLFIVFDAEKICYRIWRFMQLLIICYLFNIVQIYMITINECNSYIYVFLYISDLLYTIDVICIRYHTAIVDETGNLITNLRLIRKKRNENKWALIVALLSTLPIDVPVWFLPMSNYWRFKLLLYLRLNRQLRLYDFFMYLDAKKNQLNSNHALVRCVTLASFIFLMLQVFSCLYMKVGCIKENSIIFGVAFDCKVIDDPNGNWFDKMSNYAVSLYVIAMLMLGAVQRFQVFHDPYVLLCLALLATASTIITTFMFAEVCSIMRCNLYWRLLYETRCCHLLHFVKRRDASKQMVQKIWNYVRFLWKRQLGVTFPKMLLEAPAPLKLKVLGECYSHHITKNAVFKKCHEDFTRQLMLTLRMDTYFPGDYVVFKGDINGCMYFIHKGSVLIMSEDTCRKEDVVGKLIVGQSFGILQGLYPATAHVYFYQAVSKCDILSLNRETWIHLLDYFPASREVIFSAAEAYMGF